jgi:3-isopropylmalate/(R)-2-methylmalate dehydratase small subunit
MSAMVTCAFEMPEELVFEGRCWKFGDNVPTDAIAPTQAVVGSPDDLRRNVLRSLNPDFPTQVQPGDIVCAGRNFGCSSGRAIAPKALKSTGVGAIVAESFSRTFYRNGFEIGLPILELPGISELAREGDRLRVDVGKAVVENLTSGKAFRGKASPEFLLTMLRAGGIVALARSGKLDTLWSS